MDTTDTGRLVLAFINADDATDYAAAADELKAVFGGGCDGCGAMSDDALLSSFKRNLALLVQKTWVTDSDVVLKDSVLYRLDKFRSTDAEWSESYAPFLSLIKDAVYLMFGEESSNSGFEEYAMRIDPEFGAFWHFISSLPPDPPWSCDKYHRAITCGMLFLANY